MANSLEAPEGQDRYYLETFRKLGEAAMNLTAIASLDDYLTAETALIDVATWQKRVTERFQETKKAAYDAHRAVCRDENRLMDPLDKIEGVLRGAINTYLTACLQRARKADLKTGPEAGILDLSSVVPKTDRLTFQVRSKVTVQDPKLVPAEYLEPDMAKIKKAAERGLDIPGVSVRFEIVCALKPGAVE